jgi:cysteine desulfurase
MPGATESHIIYLDYNATTPVDAHVAAVANQAMGTLWGNPSSGHRLGRQARQAVEEARAQVAGCLGARPEEIVFTSGGTEADAWAVLGTVEARGGGHVVVSAVEHAAVLAPARELARRGRIRLTELPVDRYGQVNVGHVAEVLAPDTVLVSVMLANNEVGTLQPVAEVAELCHGHGVICHTDAAQAVGKIPVSVDHLGVDLLTVAGHKLYAPKGVGALYVRWGTPLAPLFRGAGQEGGRRAGTESVPLIVALGHACTLAARDLTAESARLAALRDRLELLLGEGFPSLIRHGHPTQRLPNTASVAFPGVDAHALLDALADSVAASAGAACHSGHRAPSHVLTAMGVDAATAAATVRFSLGRFTTPAEVEEGATRVLAAARRLAATAPR